MSKLKFDLLKNLTTKIGSGATPTGGQASYKEFGTALIRSQNVLDMSFSKNGLAFIDDEQANKLKNVEVFENDILLNITGDSIARVCKVPSEILPARVNQHVSILRTKKNLDPDFLLYYLIYKKKYLETISRVGGTRNALTKEAVENLEIRIDKNQQKVASVLSALDDKIELNNKINAELEAMAKTLYDYWFVQFDFPDATGKPYKSSGGKMVWNEALKRGIPEGWEVKTLASFINSDKSGDWGKEEKQGNYTVKVECIRGADINGINGKGDIKAPVRYILEKNKHKLLSANDFVVEISGGSPVQSTGRITCITKEVLSRFKNPLICSNFCKAVSLKDEDEVMYFLSAWNKAYDNNVLFGFEGKTSGIKNLLFENFTNAYMIVKPTPKVIKDFNNKLSLFEKKRQQNLKQNHELAQLRDWLLPMLMNGQVTVGEGEEKLNYMVI
ncbi:restriction endonuclease subunit S [Flavobacterium rhizosphaerae]|uniref:Restriction endonuclease subunit S n=1 Tax=Flavobacterium rhizosphaerae TaxID=3163298 RepID=A0ABW8YZ77_9FLAO